MSISGNACIYIPIYYTIVRHGPPTFHFYILLSCHIILGIWFIDIYLDRRIPVSNETVLFRARRMFGANFLGQVGGNVREPRPTSKYNVAYFRAENRAHCLAMTCPDRKCFSIYSWSLIWSDKLTDIVWELFSSERVCLSTTGRVTVMTSYSQLVNIIRPELVYHAAFWLNCCKLPTQL